MSLNVVKRMLAENSVHLIFLYSLKRHVKLNFLLTDTAYNYVMFEFSSFLWVFSFL